MRIDPLTEPPDADTAIRLCHQAAELNRQDPLRNGNVLECVNYGQIVVVGDLHGHRRNFRKVQQYANLEMAKVRHVILQELIHEENGEVVAEDRSHEVLLAALAWKVAYPDQIHFIQSNHELSQLTDRAIIKFGPPILQAFDDALHRSFGGDAEEVARAIDDFIVSMPLAARTPNRIFISHSLPSPEAMDQFDRTVFDRPLEHRDLDGGSAYHLVWGRGQTVEQLNDLANELDVDLFVVGHMPIETGYEVVNERLLVLASNHNHGVLLPIDLDRPTSMEGLIAKIVPLAGIA